MINKYDFAYSVALIRTLESLLLNNNEVERMILAKDEKEAFKVLNEFTSSENKSGVENPSDFQKILNEGMIQVKELLEKITPDKRVLNILFFHSDFHNIKTMVKAKMAGKSFEEIEYLMMKTGAIKPEALRKFIFEETNASFGLLEREEEYLKKKIKKVQQIFEKGHRNPQLIDLYLDQKMMKMTYNIAADSQNEFLKKYVQKLIDINNIKLFFRIKSQDKDIEIFKVGALWNGTVPMAKFREAFSREIADFPEVMSGTPYAKMVQIGYKNYEDEKSFLPFEREAENHLVDFIKQAKLIPFGPEPLIAYFLARRNNSMIARMIMVNKLNEISPEEIQPRLRNLYS